MQQANVHLPLEQRLQPQEQHPLMQQGGLLQRIRTGFATRLLGVSLALTMSYLPGCGGEDGEDTSCKTDKDCYNGQICEKVCDRYKDLCDPGIITIICDDVCVNKQDTRQFGLHNQEAYPGCD